MVPTQTTGNGDAAAPTAPGTPTSGPTKSDIVETASGFRQGKPNLLFFFWPDKEDPLGQACQELETKVFIDGQIVDLAKKFVCIRVNGKTCPPQVLRVFGVASFPTIVFQACNAQIVSSVRTSMVEPSVFAKQMETVCTANNRALEALKAREAALDAAIAKGDEAKNAGKLADARKAYEALIKKAPNTPQSDSARLGLGECRAIELVKEAEGLIAKAAYLEARGRLTIAADFELACAARDQARKLLPDCDMGAKFAEGCKLMDEGKALPAMETFGKILAEDGYSGQFRALAKQKLADLQAAWNKRS